MAYQVQQLIEGRGFPLTVTKDQLVTHALSQMIEHDFSQLPVIQDKKIEFPIGMITYEGILRGIRNFNARIDDLRIRDVMVTAPVFSEEDDLFDILDRLKETNAVLITSIHGPALIGIVTSYDTAEYFRNRTEDMMRVEDIEIMVKAFIKAAYTNDDEVLNEVELDTAIQRVTKYRSKDNEDSKPFSFDELTMGEYISLLLMSNTWSFLKPIFGIPRDSLRELLNGIREIRNSLAHFRGELSADQRDKLKFGVNWLSGRQEEFEKQKEKEKSDRLWSEHQQPKTDNEVAEASLEVAEVIHPRESRYAPLADWLQNQPGSIDQVQLTEKIEEIIGGDLPGSAYDHRVWWANDPTGHPQARLWLEAGWRSSYVNMTEKRLTYVRIRERQQAYINFFSKLLTELREKTKFPLRDITPGGSSWGGCFAIASGGSNVAQFGFSFIRSNGFRVELYIDSGNKYDNKQAFDLIYAKKGEIEAKLGEVSWERIDEKRASRIAIYHSGSITDSEEKLGKLRKWGIATMIPFIETLEPVATKAFEEVLNA